MDIISRDEAIQRQERTYFTGNPCPKGHIAPRRVINRACTECTSEYAKERHRRLSLDETYVAEARARAAKWARNNPDRYAANQKNYRDQNGEALSEYNKDWRKKNARRIKARLVKRVADDPTIHSRAHKKRYANPTYAQKCRKRSKAWRQENPERHEANNKEWRKANPDRVKAIQRAGWINRRAKQRQAGKISAADIRAIRATKRCAACRRPHPKMEIDHIISLSRGGTNHRSNLQLLCRPCNRAKWAKDPIAWAQENGRLL